MRIVTMALAVAAVVFMGVPSLTFAAPPDISAYSNAITDAVSAITTALPALLLAVLAVAAGLLVVRVGVKFARGFIK